MHRQMTLDTGSTPTHTASTPSFPVPASARVHPGASTPVKAPVTASPTATTSTTAAPGTASTHTISVPTGAGAAGNPATQSTLNTRASTHARSKHSESLSTAAIAAVVLAVVLVLACIAWALARRRAFEPHWLLSLRHAMAEAGFRLSATCAEFVDWVRLGH
jgi:hypothetical protein